MEHKIRVSCAGLIKLEIDGLNLAVLSKHQLRKGRRIYSLLGGAYKFKGRYSKKFFEELNAIFDDPLSKDLRFTLLDKKESNLIARLEKFAAFFGKRNVRSREISPTREMYEESIDETDLLTCENFPCLSYLRSVRLRTCTMRQGKEGELTEYFLELFSAELTRKTREAIRKNLGIGRIGRKRVRPNKKNQGLVRLLNRDEILRGKTEDGTPITPTFKYVIH